MASTAKRLIFDAIMTVILIIEMLVQVTGIFFHELLGVVFVATIIAHLVIEREWIATAGARAANEQGLSTKHVAKIAVAVLLLVDIALLIISSVLISTVLFNAGIRFDALYFGGIWYPIHAITSYILCALVLIHLVMHWNIVTSVLRVSYDPERREAIGQGIGAIAALGAIALGIAGATSKSVSDYVDNAQAAAEAASSPSVDYASSEIASTSAKSNSSTNSNSSSTNSSASSSSPSSSYDTYGSSSSGYTTSDTCPLCPKKCPLSAPKCDRPYDEGILSR